MALTFYLKSFKHQILLYSFFAIFSSVYYLLTVIPAIAIDLPFSICGLIFWSSVLSFGFASFFLSNEIRVFVSIYLILKFIFVIDTKTLPLPKYSYFLILQLGLSIAFVAVAFTTIDEDKVLDETVTKAAKAIFNGDLKFLDDLNNSFKCCYILDAFKIGNIDWLGSKSFYPKSCCSKLTNDEECIRENFYDRGCIEGVKNSTKNYKYFSIVLFILGLVFELMLLFTSFGLIRYIRAV